MKVWGLRALWSRTQALGLDRSEVKSQGLAGSVTGAEPLYIFEPYL